jgi:hypothetical protein
MTRITSSILCRGGRHRADAAVNPNVLMVIKSISLWDIPEFVKAKYGVKNVISAGVSSGF